jgi:hypothetical protein
MPFKSKAQRRKFYALKREGKMDQKTIDQWESETKGKLPERVKKAFKQTLSGGLADEKSPEAYSKSQLAKGKKVEMEHTTDPNKAQEIAMDHLEEYPKYYDKLEKIEKKANMEIGLSKVAKKKNRCWKGYEPVPGKKPYSDDSCRKKTASDLGLAKLAKEDKTLYQPKPSTREGKKYQVYVKGPNGNPRLIHFGATGYKHNYSPEAKKNFRARHNCDSAQKDTAKWWACNYLWNKKQKVGTKTYGKAAG